MTTTEVTIAGRTMVLLDCDNKHIIHRKGSDDYIPIRHTRVKPEDVEQYEEIAEADVLRVYTEAEYKAKVEELIRTRYSVSDELALINNVMSGVSEKRQSEYAAYQDFRDECKRKAKEMLSEKVEDILR